MSRDCRDCRDWRGIHVECTLGNTGNTHEPRELANPWAVKRRFPSIKSHELVLRIPKLHTQLIRLVTRREGIHTCMANWIQDRVLSTLSLSLSRFDPVLRASDRADPRDCATAYHPSAAPGRCVNQAPHRPNPDQVAEPLG